MAQAIKALAISAFIIIFLNACGGESSGSSSGDGSSNTGGTSTASAFGAMSALVQSLVTSPATQSSAASGRSQSVGSTYTLADAPALAISSGIAEDVVSGLFHYYGDITIVSANSVSFSDTNSCVACHGASGTGTALAPTPINSALDIQASCSVNCTEQAGLTDEINRTMPQGNTGNCSGTTPGSCAHDVASLLLNEISSTIINPGITIINPTQVRNTTEDGGMASIQMRLTTAPTSDVNIDFTSSLLTEGTVNPSRLTFNAGNFNVLQTVMVTGVPDFVVDGDTNYTVLTAPAQSADADYAGINPADINVTNIDNAAAPAVTVNPVTGLVTDENGTAVTFSVVLSSVAPTGNVLIDVTSLNTAEGLVSVAPNIPATSTTLTFTPIDYNIQQFVTVTGQDELLLDGNQTYTVSVNMNGGTADPLYAAIDPSDVVLTNNDNEVPPVIGVVVNPVNGLVTTEANQGSDTFTIRLESNPTDNVTIALASSDTTEGTVNPASVTFTPANGIVLQTVTVTGVDDALDDNDIAYMITTGDPTSAGDANYDALNAGDVADVSVTNTDDDLSQLELGQQLYRTVFNSNDANVTQSCETCHGATGLGGTTVFPVAPGACLLGNCGDATAFSAYTFTNMPRDSNALIGIGANEIATTVCDQTCSDAIAAYVFNGFSTTPAN